MTYARSEMERHTRDAEANASYPTTPESLARANVHATLALAWATIAAKETGEWRSEVES